MSVVPSKFAYKGEKTCSICGKKFIPRSNRQKYCEGPHYKNCDICGKPFIFKVSDPNTKVCSESCRIKKIKKTSQEKYGESNYSKTEEFRQKLISHNQEKYGTNCYFQSDEGKKKREETMLSRYGTTVPLQNSNIKAKFISTNNERYGGNSPMSSQETKDKAKNTFETKWGGIGAASSILQAKIETTNLEKYGCKNVGSAPEIREKIRQTNVERYGAPGYIFSDEYILPRLKHQDKLAEYIKFRDDPETYIRDSFDHKPTIQEISDKCGADIETVRLKIHHHHLEESVEFFRSTIENNILSFLYDLGLTNDEIEMQTHQVISPYELDFYIPSAELAIECNPSATHNSTVSFMNDSRIDVVSPSYHKMKSKMCEERGVFLFHLFGYEWATRQEVMKSIIANLLGKSEYRYYARNLEVKNVPYHQCMQFLSQNHRQGATSSSIRLGLYNNDELISVMTFGNIRPNQGKKDIEQWELSRFCSKINTSVIGGASKLFKAFIKQYSPESVVSFSDIARSKGTLYEKLGFKEVSRSDPSYVWTTLDDSIYYNRVSCMKSNLAHLLKDDSIDFSKTERQIMAEHGYVQVYDCGVVRWEWSR